MIMKRQKYLILAMLLVLFSISVPTFAQNIRSVVQAKEAEQPNENLVVPNCTAQPIQFGQVVNNTISGTDCVGTRGATVRADEYTFTGTTGQQIVITMNSDEENNPGTVAVDSFLILRRQSTGVAVVLTQDDDGGTNGSTGVIRNARIPAITGFFTLPANDTYSIEATTFSGGTGSYGPYTLNLIDGGSTNCAATFINYRVDPQPLPGQLQTTDCLSRGQFYTDKYAFDGVAGQSVTIDMINTTPPGPGVPLDPYLLLFGPNNSTNLLIENNDGGGGTNARITFTLPSTGTYFIDASSNLENQVGTYTLTLALNLPTGTIPVSVPNVNGTVGGTVTIPVLVGPLPAVGAANAVRSFQFTINYNPAVLRPVNNGTLLGINQTGTLSAPFNCNTNPPAAIPVPNPGAIGVGCFGPGGTPITGMGTLINLVFDVIGNGGTSSPVVLTQIAPPNNPPFFFNEGNPAAFIFTGTGSVLVGGFRLTGNTYYFTPGTESRPVAAAQVTATGNPVVQSDSNVRGAFALEGLSGSAYSVIPRKNGDFYPLNPTPLTPLFITSQDAFLTNLEAVGPSTLSLNARRAADVSGNGVVTSFDASFISQFAACPLPPAGCTLSVGNQAAQWRFVSPAIQAAPPAPNPLLGYAGAQSYTAAQIQSNLTNQNFLGILLGDVTGNFIQPCDPVANPLCTITPPTPTAVPESAVSVDLPELTNPSGTIIEIPINVGNMTGRGATSYDLIVNFDPNVLRPASSPISQEGTLSNGYIITTNTNFAGKLSVGAYNAVNVPMSGEGSLLKMSFEVIGTAGSNTALTWERFFFNEGNPASVISAGTFLVSGRTPFDFDGDGKADTTVFRSSNSIWYMLNSQAGFSATNWGLSTDLIAPADYDGDGRTDVAVVRDNLWYILQSNNGYVQRDFGLAGDLPVPGDWDNDGKADVAVYRQGTNGNQGTFYYRGTNNNPSGSISSINWGAAGDVPVVGDYDGDGRLDAAVFRSSNSVWYINQSSDNQLRALQFGISTDRTVPADYDGDGKTDIAVYRNGVWYVLKSGSGVEVFNFGLAGDIPVPADYDGDGKEDVAVYRGGIWHLLRSSQGYTSFQFGVADDKPIPASFLR